MGTDSNTLRVLEWEALCAWLARFTYTPWGRDTLSGLRPNPDREQYTERLQAVQEALDLLRTGERLPLSRVEPVEDYLKQSRVEGACLEGEELVRTAELFELVADLHACARAIRVDAPRLKARLQDLTPAPEYSIAVRRALEPDGVIKDSASPRLRELRRELGRLRTQILQKLQHLSSQLGEDSVVTVREGRHVVSVPDGARARVPGVVHDRSQSGATFFIEPMSVLEQGNELRSVESEERFECTRILRDLTAQLGTLVPAAMRDMATIADLDVLWACARWADTCGGVVPTLRDTPTLNLVAVRHPLLMAQQLDSHADLKQAQGTIVPFALELSDERRALVISGPNTGGKTVCLKTVGLTVLMIQAGIPVIADSRTAVGAFDRVFADIGDEQSLALSLSTFSAHLRRVGDACDQASASSLVLLDELGVGTDPEEGGALARAVILSLVDRGTATLVTTHYNLLKILSEENGRIANAAFVFDEMDLAPTYELVVGRPGASYALDIARRLRFPEAVVAEAERSRSDDARRLSELLGRLAEQELRLTRELALTAEKEARLNALVEFNQREREEWERRLRTAEADARREAREIVDRTRREVEHLVARIRRTHADPESVKGAHHRLSRLKDEIRPPVVKASGAVELSIGARVRVEGIAEPGEITEVYKGGDRVSVLIGNVHYQVSRRALSPCDPAPGPVDHSAAVSGSPADELREVDLRGRTVEEARLELEDHFALARAQGILEVRVIHGVGTGVLRRELSGWFRTHSGIASFRRGGPGEGGDGVSVVSLRSQ